jgi:2-keto-3-deoxy-L-rhamnonate aldolase RhmA
MPGEDVMDTPWESPLKRRLRASQPVFGCTITTGSLDTAARAATAGFHFLWLELEHSPLTLETVRNIVLATRDLPAVPFARVPVTEIWTAKRVLDAGVHGVVFPFVSTPALAQQAAAACRYPPEGRRGSGASLATSCWPDPDGYYDSADRNITTVVVVEEAGALEHIDAIAATPGVDVIFVGTGDLSFSLGLRGQQQHPRVEAAASLVAAAAKRHGKIAGRPAGSTSETQRYIEEGFLFFQAPSDLALFENGAQAFLGPHGIQPARRQRTLY